MNTFITLLGLALYIGLIGYIIYAVNKPEKCPKCGGEKFSDAGFGGWKRICDSCGWRNYGNE